MRPESRFQTAANWKNDNVTTCRYDVIVKILWCCCVSLVKLNYWSRFHVNIITSSGVMTIFVYKGLTRNSEIGNTRIWVSLNISRLSWVRDTKFCTNVSNKKLIINAKCQGYSFYYFWVIVLKTSIFRTWVIWINCKVVL